MHHSEYDVIIINAEHYPYHHLSTEGLTDTVYYLVLLPPKLVDIAECGVCMYCPLTSF